MGGRVSFSTYSGRFFFFTNRCRSFENAASLQNTRARGARRDPGNFPSYASTASRGEGRGGGEGGGMRESLSNPCNGLMFSWQLVVEW